MDQFTRGFSQTDPSCLQKRYISQTEGLIVLTLKSCFLQEAVFSRNTLFTQRISVHLVFLPLVLFSDIVIFSQLFYLDCQTNTNILKLNM